MTTIDDEYILDGRIYIDIDIVFVIDVTHSMQTMIDKVKEEVLSCHEKICDAYKKIDVLMWPQLRVKIVWFRDFYYDGESAYGESEFFVLPKEKESFRDFINELETKGGGDKPESALEALTLAMRSDFTELSYRGGHIIVLFTDAEAHAFEDHDRLVEEAIKNGAKPGEYPENMPKGLFEFFDAWHGNTTNRDVFGSGGEPTKLDIKSQRMVLFAPHVYPWYEMDVELEYLIRKDIETEEGCAELDMSEVYEMITNSL